MSETSVALVRTETVAPVATTQRAIILREALKEDEEQRALLSQYIHHHMKEGTDFGIIPGTAKPSLLKPGAEKLVDLFRCTPKFSLLTREEDFESGFFNYMFRVRLVSRDTAAVLAEGFGSGNSREGRYRWRDAQRKCPNCGKTTIIKGKQEYGGGWLCFTKKGGCNAKWPDGAQEIESQALGKVENDDVATLANTILKMAKKRALVDGAIALARCSDMFTQDVEDLVDASHAADAVPVSAEPPPGELAAKPTPAQKAAVKAAPARTVTPPPSPARASARDARSMRIWRKAQAAGATKETFGPWVSSVLGHETPSNRWTEGDMDALEEALQGSQFAPAAPEPEMVEEPLDAEFVPEPPAEPEPTVRQKGQDVPVSQLSAKSMEFWADKLAKDVQDANKARWREQNERTLRAIQLRLGEVAQ